MHYYFEHSIFINVNSSSIFLNNNNYPISNKCFSFSAPSFFNFIHYKSNYFLSFRIHATFTFPILIHITNFNFLKSYKKNIHHHNHRHQVAMTVRNFLTFSYHPSLSSIAPGRSTQVASSVHTELMYVSLYKSINTNVSMYSSL